MNRIWLERIILAAALVMLLSGLIFGNSTVRGSLNESTTAQAGAAAGFPVGAGLGLVALALLRRTGPAD